MLKLIQKRGGRSVLLEEAIKSLIYSYYIPKVKLKKEVD
jgi:hypothetical protein